MASSLRVNSIVPSSGTNVAIGTAGGTVTYAASVSGISTFSSGIVVSAGSTSAPSISPSGNSNTGIFFPSADTVAFAEGGVEAARFDSNGRLGIGTQIPSAVINVRSSAAELARFTNTGSNGGDWEVKLGGGGFENRKFMLTDKFGGTDNVRVSIDSSGRVTMPYQPHAEGGITGLSNASPSSSTIITFNRVDVNVGNHYDTTNYRFNCPVNGNYLVHAHAQVNGQTATTLNTVNFNIRKNAASVSGVYESRYYGGTAPAYVKLEITDVVYANAGDYLDIYALISNTSLSLEYGSADIRWRFSYTLLG